MSQRRTFLLAAGVVIAGALVLAVLAPSEGAPQSPFTWLQYPLLALLAWGMFTVPEEGRAPVAFLPCVGFSWLLGMAVEMTLTVDGTGIGGVHADTFSSFVLAQGDYIPLALLVWCFHRFMGAQVDELLWITAGIGLTEGLVFTGSVTGAVTTGALVGSLVVTGYLVAIYWVFLVLPFRLSGAGRGERRRNLLLLIGLGFVSAFAVRLFWGLIYSPAVTAIFGLAAQ